MNRIIVKHLTAFLLFSFLSIFLIFVWFHYGLIYGGGDVGLTTYNPKRIAEVISKVWWEDTAPGFPRPQGLASLPTELALSILQSLGFPDFAIQATLFGLILFLMGFGMYLLTREIVEDKKIALLAGLFYMINPYMMVQVWHRFVHSTFFLAAGLPFFLLFWRRWIEKRNIQSLVIFLLLNLLFSFTYSTLAYMITVWGLLSYLVIFEIFIPWKGTKNTLKILVSFLIGFGFWLLTNVWWLMPVFFVSPSLLSSQHSIVGSVLTLISISSQAIIPYSLAGLNPFYLFSQMELGEVFSHPLFLLIPWIYTLFIFVGIFSSLKKRVLIFFSGLFLISIFFAKGIATPFGALFFLGFTKSLLIGVLRNPFEKLGILIPFAGSILFASGFVISWNLFRRNNYLFGKAILLLAFGFIFGIYHWPFWSGMLFGTLERSNLVGIPSYYSQANDWIKGQHKAGNILHLPVLINESLTYRWEHGYSGVESSTDFFTSNPSISMGFNLFHIDNALASLDLITEVLPQEDGKIESLLRAFNVKFLVLHQDLHWQKSRTKDPLKVLKKLDSLSFLIKQKEFGPLIIYEIKDSNYLSKIYTANNIDYLIGFTDIPVFDSSWAWYARNDSSKVAISDLDFLENDRQNIELVVLPKKVTTFHPSEDLNSEEAVKRLAAIKLLPDSPLYFLIKIKEMLNLTMLDNTMKNLELELAGKRLVEAYLLIKRDPQSSISAVIKEYVKILPTAMDKIDKLTKATTLNKEVPDAVKSVLNNHSIILKFLKENVKGEEKNGLLIADNLLSRLKIEQGISIIYERKDLFLADSLPRQVLRYDIPFNGQYELLFANSSVETVYQDGLNKLDFQINGKREERGYNKKFSFLSYGFIDLTRGEYEISHPRLNSRNLFKGFPGGKEEYEISSTKHELTTFNIDVTPYYSGETYAISFDFWVKKGSDPRIRAIQNSDPVDLIGFDLEGKQRLYQYEQTISSDPYNKHWRKFVYFLDTRKNSNDLTFQIEIYPWDDCKANWEFNQKLCENKEIKRNYERPSTVVISNLKVYSVFTFTNPLFLRLKEDATSSAKLTNITYTNPQELVYKGSFNIDRPSYLVFSETFDKGWKLQLVSQSKNFEPKVHVLANMFANAWYIDEPGNFEFKLEYEPQRYFNIGLFIGSTSYFLLIIFLLLKSFKTKVKRD